MKTIWLLAIIITPFFCFWIVGIARGETLSHLEIARMEIGHGEQGGNNLGPDIKRYGQGKDGEPWCASFVSYCLNEAGIDELGYPMAAKVIWNKGRKLGWQVKEPQSGDLICFWRVKPTSWQGHVGVIVSVTQTEIRTVEANLGVFPSIVKERTYAKNDIPRLLGYLRPKKEKRK